MKYYGNIFEDFLYVKNMVLNSEEFADEEYLKLIDAIETFFKLRKWCHSNQEYKVYLYSGKKYSTGKVAGIIGENINTYRSRVSRISSRIRTMLLDGKSVQEVFYGDIEVVRKYRLKIEHLNVSFDFYEECLVWERIAPVISAVSASEGVSEEELFQALLFLVTYSKSAVDKKLALLSPEALSVVAGRLSGADYDEMMSYYNNCLGLISLPRMTEQRLNVYKQIK